MHAKRTLTIVIAAAVIGAVLVTGTLGGVSAQDDGVAVPEPSNTPDGDGLPDPYDCGDFETVEQVRAVFAQEYPDDTSELDENDNDIPCESPFPGQTEPVTPDTTTSAPATTSVPATDAPATDTETETMVVEETTVAPDTVEAETDAEGDDNQTGVEVGEDVAIGDNVTIGSSENTTSTETVTVVSDNVEGTATEGGNGKAKMGDGGDGDDTADGGNGKSKSN